MKILILEEKPCPFLLQYINDVCKGKFEYVGMSVKNGTIVHIIKCGGKLRAFVNTQCRLSQIVSKSAVIHTPEFRGGKFYFCFLHQNGLENAVRGCRYWVIDVKNFKLTERQLQVLALYLKGGLKLVEEELGIHKSTASRLVKRGIRKLLLLYSFYFTHEGRRGLQEKRSKGGGSRWGSTEAAKA